MNEIGNGGGGHHSHGGRIKLVKRATSCGINIKIKSNRLRR